MVVVVICDVVHVVTDTVDVVDVAEAEVVLVCVTVDVDAVLLMYSAQLDEHVGPMVSLGKHFPSPHVAI